MLNKCKICGAITVPWHYPKQMDDFHYCEVCEFIAKDDSAMMSSEDELKRYNEHNNEGVDPQYIAYFKTFLEDAVFPYANTGKIGLDFGSGPQPVLANLLSQQYHYQMAIYDLFYAMDQTYSQQQYDLITTTEVVEHLQDPLHYFKHFKELLLPTGILAVMTQFHQNDPQKFMGWYYMRDHSHISFFTPKTMAVIGQKVGLRVIYSNGIKNTTFVLQ